jgi:hypothetical protein
VRIDVRKVGFMLNPTSCDPTKVTSNVTSTEGATANLSDRFQAAGCAGLGFKPTVAPKLLGGRQAAKRRSHPRLQVTVKEPKSQANLSAISFAVPNKILLDQSHIKTVCTRVQFAAQKCPAASIYGTAKATTPLLDKPLQGPVYLRSSNNKLPDPVVDLKGQIEIVLGPQRADLDLRADDEGRQAWSPDQLGRPLQAARQGDRENDRPERRDRRLQPRAGDQLRSQEGEEGVVRAARRPVSPAGAPTWMVIPGLRSGEGCGRGSLRPGKGCGRVGLAPGGGMRPGRAAARVRDVAVSATALAGCGRGRDGRGCEGAEEGSREDHGSATDPSPMSDLVTETPRMSLFLPSSSDVAIT